MKDWQKISSLLCLFGFLRELRPSEPYVTEFLLGPWRNITQEQVGPLIKHIDFDNKHSTIWNL